MERKRKQLLECKEERGIESCGVISTPLCLMHLLVLIFLALDVVLALHRNFFLSHLRKTAFSLHSVRRGQQGKKDVVVLERCVIQWVKITKTICMQWYPSLLAYTHPPTKNNDVKCQVAWTLTFRFFFLPPLRRRRLLLLLLLVSLRSIRRVFHSLHEGRELWHRDVKRFSSQLPPSNSL